MNNQAVLASVKLLEHFDVQTVEDLISSLKSYVDYCRYTGDYFQSIHKSTFSLPACLLKVGDVLQHGIFVDTNGRSSYFSGTIENIETYRDNLLGTETTLHRISTEKGVAVFPSDFVILLDDLSPNARTPVESIKALAHSFSIAPYGALADLLIKYLKEVSI